MAKKNTYNIKTVDDVTPALVLSMINDESNTWLEVILREYGRQTGEDKELNWVIDEKTDLTPHMFWLCTTCGPDPNNKSELRRLKKPDYVRNTMLSKNSAGEYIFIDRMVRVMRRMVERMINDKKLVAQPVETV